MALVYNVNSNATNVLAAKQIKENIFVSLLHRNGKGITEQTETNVSTLRILKPAIPTGDARKIGEGTNGGFFNSESAGIQNIIEYDLPLLYVYDKNIDIPEVQQDLVPVNVFDAATKNIAGRISTEINASTLAEQLANRFNAADTANAWTDIAVVLGTEGAYAFDAVMDASTALDEGDPAQGIQAFPFEERELIMRPSFRRLLMSQKGVLVGGSNYAQSMIAKGALSPEEQKEFGNMYCGEIDLVPCYICPSTLWNRAGEWAGSASAFNDVEAVMVAASATDRGISTLDYIKTIPSPDGAGIRLQPKTRWGVNVCYGKGVVPIVKNDASNPSAQLTIMAPGSRAK